MHLFKNLVLDRPSFLRTKVRISQSSVDAWNKDPNLGHNNENRTVLLC